MFSRARRFQRGTKQLKRSKISTPKSPSNAGRCTQNLEKIQKIMEKSTTISRYAQTDTFSLQPSRGLIDTSHRGKTTTTSSKCFRKHNQSTFSCLRHGLGRKNPSHVSGEKSKIFFSAIFFYKPLHFGG